MSEGFKLALTALAGIAVFVVGQIIVKLFIEPIQEQWKLRGKIVHALSFYDGLDRENIPPELITEWSHTVRNLASELQASVAVPGYRLLSIFGLVINQRNVYGISSLLVQMTYVPPKVVDNYNLDIRRRLKVKGLVTASNIQHRRKVGWEENEPNNVMNLSIIETSAPPNQEGRSKDCE